MDTFHGVFFIQKGCRQGEPISLDLFLCLVILAMIHQNKKIKGISIDETEHKISQYADDTEIMLEGDKKSFETIIKTLDVFEKRCGRFLHSCMWVSPVPYGLVFKRNSTVRYMPHFHMEWNPLKFNAK